MSTVYSLDKLREDIEKKFEPIKIDLGDDTEVVLGHLMRLPKAKRKQITDLLKSNRDEDDSVDTDKLLTNLLKVIELAATDPAKGKQLVRALGDDLAMTSEIVRLWSEATQLGEA